MDQFVRKLVDIRNLFSVYASLYTRITPTVIVDAREQLLSVEIEDSDTAEYALKQFSDDIPTDADRRLIDFKISQLRSIEARDDYKRIVNKSTTLYNGQDYKVIYILDAQRRYLDLSSYSVTFDVVLRDSISGHQVARTESGTLVVTPNRAWLTFLAVSAGLVGAAVESMRTGATMIRYDSLYKYVETTWRLYLLSALVALVFFNIFDFTSIRDRIKANISWRVAVLVGFLCGLFNEKVLAAFDAFLH